MLVNTLKVENISWILLILQMVIITYAVLLLWVGECFFWYRLTRVVPDKFHRAAKRLCVCVCAVSIEKFTVLSIQFRMTSGVCGWIIAGSWHVCWQMIHLPVYRHTRRFLASMVVFGSIVLVMLWLPVQVVRYVFPNFLPFHVMLSRLELFCVLIKLCLPSVLWRCWLGGRKGIRPVKKLSGGVLAWLSGMRCRLAYSPADATAIHYLLLQ